MLALLNNPWIIGIGGGIFSGLVVTLISRFVLSKRENREYLQKLHSANREILYAIRPGISEGQLPIPAVVDALRKSTARKYSVNSEDIWSVSELTDELIKEVMDSSFISSSSKHDFCSKLSELSESADKKTNTSAEKLEPTQITTAAQRIYLLESRSRMITIASTMMGIMAGTMSLAFLLLEYSKPKLLDLPTEDLRTLIPALASVAVALAALLLTFLLREVKEIRRRSNWASFGNPYSAGQFFRLVRKKDGANQVHVPLRNAKEKQADPKK